MKGCELCKSAAARMYCDSDQARLCWDCDAKVHSANFLVARHSRTLLCHACQSPTPWSASGEKLGRTVSVCEGCVHGLHGAVKDAEEARNDEESDGGYDGEEVEEEDVDGVEDDDDEEGENQVVPWSSTAPPPQDASSSSSEESSSRFCNGGRAAATKRFRRNVADRCSDDDDHSCSSAHRENRSPPRSETVFVEPLRPLKRQRTDMTGTSTTNAEMMETVVENCNLRENPGVVCSESSRSSDL